MENIIKPIKPLKPKPIFYSMCFPRLQQIALEHGYNLLIHGSMSRDMDLVAIPWIDEPKPHIDMLDAFSMYLKDVVSAGDDPYCHSLLPGGRDSYVISLNRGGKFNGYVDEQYYLDISITPLISSK